MEDRGIHRADASASEGYEPPTLEVIGTLREVTLGQGGSALPDEFETVISP